MKKLISIVISAYNEERVVNELARRLKTLMSAMGQYRFEVIIVDHGSTDRTFILLKKIHEDDPRFKIVQLSRNFGFIDYGLTAGIDHASGDAVVLMNADLQDPPEVIPRFLAKWEDGYDIAYGVIVKREGVSTFRKLISPFFYWVMNVLTNGEIPKNATDFRVIDKAVYEQIKLMPEHNRFLRGMTVWTGFRQIGIPFVRAPRFAKGSDGGGSIMANPFGLSFRMFRWISNAVFSFSSFPLKLINVMGVFISICSFLLAIYYVSYYVLYGTASPSYTRGWTSTILSVLFLFGLLFISLGIIGEYIARIYDEVKRRPLYIVRRKIGFGKRT
jgi:polyisoprenyl-phosphate glycosyltransferase